MSYPVYVELHDALREVCPADQEDDVYDAHYDGWRVQQEYCPLQEWQRCHGNQEMEIK